jgi:methylmalonyl-CoA/ethylmalonyl-CoA epimerase
VVQYQLRRYEDMAKQKESRVKLPAPNHLGIVVKDMDQAMEYYSSTFGWGPFEVQEVDMKMFPFTFRGQPGSGRFKVAIARLGSMVVELFQVLEGDTPYSDFHQQKGEGVHHLGFQVDDFDAALATLTQEGIEPIFHGRFGDGAFAYFNTDKIGGVVFELLNFSPFG